MGLAMVLVQLVQLHQHCNLFFFSHFVDALQQLNDVPPLTQSSTPPRRRTHSGGNVRFLAAPRTVRLRPILVDTKKDQSIIMQHFLDQ